jgi:hypothetical protein
VSIKQKSPDTRSGLQYSHAKTLQAVATAGPTGNLYSRYNCHSRTVLSGGFQRFRSKSYSGDMN